MDRKYIVALLLIAIPVLLIAGWTRLPNTVWYKRGRPTRFGKATNRAMSWFSSVGIPLMVTLEVRGRKTGRISSTVLVPARVGEDEFLVSMLGEQSEWVRNLRASGGKAIIRHGRRREVVLEDVPVAQRAPILKAYLKRAPGARPHFPIGPNADEPAFEAIAEQYPVFKVRRAAVVKVTPARRPAGAARP